MKCDVFRGIGGTAHKYYLLFQHHLPPPSSTYTTGKDVISLTPFYALTLTGHPLLNSREPDTEATTVGGEARQGNDPNQAIDTYVAPSKVETEMGYILGPKAGVSFARLKTLTLNRMLSERP